jgi:hypothetical protein
LAAAARGVHEFVLGGMLEKNSQTIGAVPVTAGGRESVWFKETFGASHTRSQLQAIIGSTRIDSRSYLRKGSRIQSRIGFKICLG